MTARSISDESSYEFTEIGSIAPSSNVIQARYIDYGGSLNNTLAFLVETNRGVVALYNVTDPLNTVELDSYALSSIHDIDLDEERKLLYVTASNGTNILRYNNPIQLEYVSAYTNYSISTFIHVLGEMLYVGAEDEGLHIVSMTDPYNPEFITSWNDAEGDVGPVYIIDDYTYSCTCTGEGVYVEKFGFVGIRTPNVDTPPTPIGLRILNLTDLNNISLLGTPELGDYFNTGVPQTHDAANNLAFIPDFENGLTITKYGFPLSLMPYANFKDGEGSIVNDVAITDEEIAFLAINQGGLQVIDVSDLENMKMIGSYSHQWQTLRIAIMENVVYLATLGGGVRILTWKLVQNRQIPIHTGFIIACLLFGIVVQFYRMRKK